MAFKSTVRIQINLIGLKEKFKAQRTIENLAKVKQVIQSTTHISNTDILIYSRVSKNIL